MLVMRAECDLTRSSRAMPSDEAPDGRQVNDSICLLPVKADRPCFSGSQGLARVGGTESVLRRAAS